jgi:hypothetical protein
MALIEFSSWMEWLAAAGLAVLAAAVGSVCLLGFLVWLAGRPNSRR